MKCPYCQEDGWNVVDSRTAYENGKMKSKNGDNMKKPLRIRTYRCNFCKRQYNTFELPMDRYELRKFLDIYQNYDKYEAALNVVQNLEVLKGENK